MSDTLSPHLTEIQRRYYQPLSRCLNDQLISLRTEYSAADKTLFVGICGGQGSGKSTLCQLTAALLKERFGLSCAVLSLDDLYLSPDQRQSLAQKIHPLLRTRGVPGTHDIDLGLRLFQQLDALSGQQSMILPRFNKSLDCCFEREQWQKVTGLVDIVLFEGWCVGAKPVADNSLLHSVNDLEIRYDSQGVWRHYVNTQLSGSYAELFARLNFLIMLQVPDMEAVVQWRTEQELTLAQPLMGVSEIRHFVQHYQRITEQLLRDMPSYADLRFELNRDHGIAAVWSGNKQLLW